MTQRQDKDLMETQLIQEISHSMAEKSQRRKRRDTSI